MGWIEGPMCVGSDHGVEDHKQLAHAGGDYDFERFAGLLKAIGEGG